METLANRDYGADYITSIAIYRTLIRKKVDNGAIAYASAPKSTL